MLIGVSCHDSTSWRRVGLRVIHGEALHRILVQSTDGPLPELRAAVAADAETDGQNSLQRVVASPGI